MKRCLSNEKCDCGCGKRTAIAPYSTASRGMIKGQPMRFVKGHRKLPCPIGSPLARRFWKRVNKRGPIPKHMPHLGHCWVWTGYVDKDGYGRIKARVRLAHRLSFALTHGDIPKGLAICHACDNRRCVRPSHLFKGSMMQNAIDRASKGRSAVGTRYPQAKLNPGKIKAIRRDINLGLSDRKIASLYGVGKTTIGLVRNHKLWKHVS